VSLDNSRLFSREAVLLGLLALVVQSVVSVLNLSGESSSLSGSEEFNDLLSGEGVDLLRSVSSEGVLLDAFLFFWCSGHCLVMVKFILFINWMNLLFFY
jgi:hypothetical protein